jgi:alpha-L-rhamnosidase
VVAGLDIDEDSVGHRRILVRPRPGGGLSHAQADWMTEFGKAAVSWILENGRMTVDVTVPHNTTARVVLPGAPIGLDGAEVRFAKCDGGAQAVVGSGNYTFICSCGA